MLACLSEVFHETLSISLPSILRGRRNIETTDEPKLLVFILLLLCVLTIDYKIQQSRSFLFLCFAFHIFLVQINKPLNGL